MYVVMCPSIWYLFCQVHADSLILNAGCCQTFAPPPFFLPCSIDKVEKHGTLRILCVCVCVCGWISSIILRCVYKVTRRASLGCLDSNVVKHWKFGVMNRSQWLNGDFWQVGGPHYHLSHIHFFRSILTVISQFTLRFFKL